MFYLGMVKVNLIGYSCKNLSTLLWVMTSLEPEGRLEIFQARIKIEETFRDSFDLLHLPQVMTKRQDNLEKMIAFALMAFAVAVLVWGSCAGCRLGRVEPAQHQDSWFGKGPNPASEQHEWRLYSGQFVLLKQKPRLPKKVLNVIALE